MEEFALYLFRSVMWITGFTFIWLVFLRNENFFLIKRIYLIAGILASFLLPLLTIRYAVEIPFEGLAPSVYDTSMDMHETAALAVPGKKMNPLILLYLAGAAIFFLRLIWHLTSLYRMAITTGSGDAKDGKIILSAGYSSPFSFFGYIFINPELTGGRFREIINHEMAHIRQKHWIDLVLAELLCMLQWFNPVAWIYKNFIRQNHEYLADREALRKSADPAFYKATLLNQLFGSVVIPLTNPFIESLSKKRFDMMKKTKIHPLRKLRLLPLLPVMALIFWFCSEEYYDLVTVDGEEQPSGLVSLSNTVSVSGYVFGDNGPIDGAGIIVSGSSIREVTDREGFFEIYVPEGSSITFSARGYATSTLRRIHWREPHNPLTIGVRLYKDRVNRSRPAPEPQPSIYVIDGVIKRSMSGVDFRDIESFTRLSGEEAVRVYGVQARAGAHIITTKK
jgi:hypothetical protein